MSTSSTFGTDEMLNWSKHSWGSLSPDIVNVAMRLHDINMLQRPIVVCEQHKSGRSHIASARRENLTIVELSVFPFGCWRLWNCGHSYLFHLVDLDHLFHLVDLVDLVHLVDLVDLEGVGHHTGVGESRGWRNYICICLFDLVTVACIQYTGKTKVDRVCGYNTGMLWIRLLVCAY